MRKRLIASLLIFAMVFTLFPAPVFAAYGDRDPEHPEWGMELNDYTKDVNVPGLVIKDYQLMEQGDDGHYAPVYTLVFSLAEGYDAAAIPDFTTAGSAPWNEIGELVKYVYIKDGITAIGDNTFADMPVLETATIEDSSKLTRIGANAFANDRRLTISANAEGERVLALPNVTEIGANAFVNCTNLGGSRSGGYTRLELGSRLTSIGASAFTACGLRYIEFTTLEPGVSLEIGTSAFSSNSPVDLTLPEGLISIGDAAFSHNTLTFSDANPEHELTIPDSVVSIGKNAFFISTDTKNDSLYKLTLGKNLESIGESAFRNYMELAVIDVRTIKQNLAIGDYAFGHDPSDAYSGIIRDESGQEYLSGAKFNIIGEGLDEAEKETVANAFVNGENCYMGEVSPLKLVETLEPTCLTKGRYTYEFSVKGQTEPKTLYEEIPELEHQYEAAGLVDGSCEFDGGQLEKCYQAAVFAGQVKDGVNGEKNVSIEADGYHYKLNTDSAYGNTGHDYQPVELTNPVIGAAADATALVYACQQEGHRVAGEYEDYGNVVQADTLPEKVTFTIPSTVVSATPFTTVAELRTKIAGIKVNGGSLSLAASYGDDATFTSDQELAVVFTPDPVQYRDYDNMSAAGEAGGQTLKIKVVIEKVDFDLTKTFFQDTTEVVDLDATQPGKGASVSPDTQPAGTEKVDVYYRPSGSDDESAWTSTPPVPKQAGTWELKAVFTYDPVYYEVRNTQHIDASRYQISYDSDAPGTVTLLSTYQVVPNDMSSLSWSPRSQMSYTGEALNRIRLLNVPVGSEISYTWTKNGEPQEPVSGIIAQPSGDNKLVGVDIAAILDAGEYVLTKVTVTCDGYSNGYLENISFTVAKRQVPLPSPVQGLSYKPGVSQTGVVENNALYILEDSCSKIDAGTYEGVVRLVDSSNNQWADPAWKDGETAKVSFEIAPVRVARPAASPAYGIGSSVPYDGTQHVVVPLPGTAADFTYEYNAAGSLIAVYHYQGVEETALTITNAVQTDAGNYQTIAVLSGNAGGKENYVWGASAGDLAGTTADYTYDGGWSIAPARVAAPGVSVGTDNEVSYTGQALDESLIAVGDMLWSGFAQELPGGASLKVDHFEYYQNGAAVSGGTPAKQGSYELRVYYRVENGKAGQ